MAKKQLSWLSIIPLLLSFTLFVPLVMADQTETTVIGIVKDDVYLETTDGKLIKVAETEMGFNLLERVGEKVEVLGVISQEKGKGVPTIRVTAFMVSD